MKHKSIFSYYKQKRNDPSYLQLLSQSHDTDIGSATAMTNKPIAIIAGVGSGTGASLARRFAKSYPVVLLARNPSNFDALAEEINKSGGEAIGISTDVSSEESVKNAFAKIKEVHGGAPVAAMIFNASARPSRKPFLELTTEEFGMGWGVSVYVARFSLKIYEVLTNLNRVEKAHSTLPKTPSRSSSRTYSPTLLPAPTHQPLSSRAPQPA